MSRPSSQVSLCILLNGHFQYIWLFYTNCSRRYATTAISNGLTYIYIFYKRCAFKDIQTRSTNAGEGISPLPRNLDFTLIQIYIYKTSAQSSMVIFHMRATIWLANPRLTESNSLAFKGRSYISIDCVQEVCINIHKRLFWSNEARRKKHWEEH